MPPPSSPATARIRGLKVALPLRPAIWAYVRFFRPKPVILGQELAGQVEAVGKDVQRFKPGDAVFAATGLGLGTYAEYKCMPVGRQPMGGALALKPANVTYAEAAAVPVGGLEALHFVRRTRIQPGERVLINGAGGSIGTVAIQLAKGLGAEVTAVDHGAKLDMLRAIGADHVVDYSQTDFTRAGATYDVVIDVVGKSSFARTLRVLAPNGRYYLGNPGMVQRAQARWTSTGSRQALVGTGPQRAADLDYLREQIEAGRLKPVIDRTYPLEQMAEAHRYVDSGQRKGNVAILVAPREG